MLIIKQKFFNQKFVISTLASILFALLLRLFFNKVLELPILIDTLDIANISYCSLVTIFRALLGAFLDEFFAHKLPMGSGGQKVSEGVFTYSTNNKTILSMQDKSQSHHNSSHESSSVNSSTKKLSTDDKIELMDNLYSNLKSIQSTLQELRDYKHSKKVIILVDKNDDLSVDVPGKMSQSEAEQVTSKVLELDSKYNDLLDVHNSLVEKDKKLNHKDYTKIAEFKKYKKNLSEYKKDVYTKED